MAYKRLTAKEKKERAKTKKWLQEEGFIRPDKKPLNRKKFIEETEKVWDGREAAYDWGLWVMRAAVYMMNHQERAAPKASLEAVGAAKVLRLAVALRDFHGRKWELGEKITLGEEYEEARKIMEL